MALAVYAMHTRATWMLGGIARPCGASLPSQGASEGPPTQASERYDTHSLGGRASEARGLLYRGAAGEDDKGMAYAVSVDGTSRWTATRLRLVASPRLRQNSRRDVHRTGRSTLPRKRTLPQAPMGAQSTRRTSLGRPWLHSWSISR